MKNLVELLAKSLVDSPEKVNVQLIEKEKSCVIELRVSPEDMGKVIGRQGRIARAIRTMVKAAATKSNKKVVVDII
jgi:predicted RNA-binding protein YlqC (UPF0109 family)